MSEKDNLPHDQDESVLEEALKELYHSAAHGDISPEDFIKKLEQDFAWSQIADQWSVIRGMLEKRRSVRNAFFKDLLHDPAILQKLWISENDAPRQKLNAVRGILANFKNWGVLVEYKAPGCGHPEYLCNLPEFYQPEELYKLLPEDVLTQVAGKLTAQPMKLEDLASALKIIIGQNLLAAVLEYYVLKGTVQKNRNGYKLVGTAKALGTAPEGLAALNAWDATKELTRREYEESRKAPPKNLEELDAAMRKDIDDKTIKPINVETQLDRLVVPIFAEPRIGNQWTDMSLIRFAINELKKDNPDVVVVSGGIEGDHRHLNVELQRVLSMAAGLNHIHPQYTYLNQLLKELEAIAPTVFYQLGDAELDHAKGETLDQMRKLFDLRKTGASARFAEEVAQIAGVDFINFGRLWTQVVLPYCGRIGRYIHASPEEVGEVVPGLNKDEFLLILLIELFKKAGLEIPPEYLKVVDAEALAGDKAGSRRHVTPDNIMLDWKGHKILIEHRLGYSDKTAYLDPTATSEKRIKQLQAKGTPTARMYVGCNSRLFFMTGIHNTFVVSTPGLIDSSVADEGRMKIWPSRPLADKSNKIARFRGMLATPGVPEFEFFADGRMRYRILTPKIQRIVEANRGRDEIKESLAVFQDVQTGSPTARLEWNIYAHDYALWERKVEYAIYNGDLVHGRIYPQFVSESRHKRLMSINSQIAMFIKCFLDFYPAPGLKALDSLMGNHEWKNFGAAVEGLHPLAPWDQRLIERHQSARKAGLLTHDVEIMPRSRIRMLHTGNPGGSSVMWPYVERTICDGWFQYAGQHRWGHSGRTPAHHMMTWATNMAEAAKDIDVLIGGHYHSLWNTLLSDILMLHLPGLVDVSGYELAMGLTPKSLFSIIEFSTHRGITVELIPPQFLISRRLICPAYAGLEDALKRPEPKDEREYKLGLESPLIEKWLEEIDMLYPSAGPKRQ
jgi:hypothetical protein